MTDTTYPTDPVEHSDAVESLREKTREYRGKEQTIFEAKPEAQNSMVYWFPVLRDAVQDIDEISIPETLFVDITPINGFEVAREREDISDAEMEAIMQCPAEWDVPQIKRAVEHIGCPAFLRTDTDSDKHNIESAGLVESSSHDHVDETMNALIRGVAGNGGMMGAPRFNFLAVREWININSSFTAFDGTPIGPEVRVFVRDGSVQCHHFYWPFYEDRMVDAVDGEYEEDKQKQVEEIEAFIEDEMDRLLHDAAAEIASHFSGYWSVDFAYTENGDWHAIDMARGDDSWHPEMCEHVETEPEQEEDEELLELIEEVESEP